MLFAAPRATERTGAERAVVAVCKPTRREESLTSAPKAEKTQLTIISIENALGNAFCFV